MGVVYRAVHRETGAEVALKTLEGSDAADAHELRREIRALARLRHPNVVRVLDHGVADGLPWYAMERVDGPDLRSLLEAPGDVPVRTSDALMTFSLELGEAEAPSPEPADALPAPARSDAVWTILRRLCHCLAWLHGEGVVHGDIKPENILVRGVDPVLVDFGLAGRVGGTEELDLRRAMGTARYISPEQLDDAAPDARSDLYALGCLLYEVLTGRPPFLGPTVQAVLHQHLQVVPLPPSERGSAHPELDEVVLALLEKDRRHRLGHAGVVEQALAALDPRELPGDCPTPQPSLYRPPFLGRSGLVERIVASDARLGVVVGDPGMGATRVLQEVARRAPVEVVAARFSAVGEGRVEQAVLQVLARRWAAGVPPERAHAARLLARYEPTLAELPGVRELQDPPRVSGEAGRERLRDALVQALIALGDVPTWLVLDDLHLAGPLVPEVLEDWQGSGAHALRIIAAGQVAGLPDSLPGVRWALDPLDREAIGGLVAGMLSLPAPPSGLAERLHGESGGNPRLAAEQLVAAVHAGFLERDTRGRWRAALSEGDGWSRLPTPRSLADAARVRLEQLDAVAREGAGAAAVLGLQVDGELLEALGHSPELLVARRVLDPDHRFAFAALRRVALDELEPDRRKALHRRASELLAERGAPRIERALHLADAEAPEAFDELVEAGRAVRARGDLDEALRAFERALQIREDAELRWVLAELLFIVGETRRVGAHGARLLQGTDPTDRVRGGIVEARAHETEGRFAEALASYRAADALARAEGDAYARSLAATHLAIGLRHTGDLGGADGAAERALEDATTSALRGRALHQLANNANRRGERKRAIGLYQRAIEALDAAGMPAGALSAQGNLATVLRSEGRLEDAIALLEDTLRRSLVIGARKPRGIHLGNMGITLLDLGRNDEAAAFLEQALAVHRDVGSRRGAAVLLGNLSVADHELGRFEQAVDRLEQALEAHREGGERSFEGWTLAQLGKNLASLGRLDAARLRIEEAVELLTDLDDDVELAHTRLELARLERLSGRSEEAARAIQLAMDDADPMMGPLLCAEAGRIALTRGQDAGPWLERGRDALGARGAASEAGRAVAGLARAIDSAERLAGEDVRDLPGPLRAALARRP